LFSYWPREVHPLKSIGCFIKKLITAEQLLRQLEQVIVVDASGHSI